MHEHRRNSKGEALPPRRPDEPDYDGKLAGAISIDVLIKRLRAHANWLERAGYSMSVPEIRQAADVLEHRHAREQIEGRPARDFYGE